jgi:EAL domain-containing protein (putative c-di-GMP-specific phosphodiesterase class I)
MDRRVPKPGAAPVLTISKYLDATVIAEGIETRAQAQMLMRLGCRLPKAISLDALERWKRSSVRCGVVPLRNTPTSG